MDEKDIDMWQRLLQRNGSMPQTQRPTPRVTNPPIAIITPNPTTPSPVTPRCVYIDDMCIWCVHKMVYNIMCICYDITLWCALWYALNYNLTFFSSSSCSLLYTSPTVTKATPSPVNSCGLTPTERREQIEENLSPVSSSALSNQIPTPQRSALNWIIDDDGAQLCPDDDSLVQRYTLAVFYYSTNGDDWKECNAPSNFDRQASIAAANSACTLTTVNATTIFPNDVRGTNAWLTPESECKWGGISCYASNTPNAIKVNVVEFENNGLSGVLPAEMEQLTKMRFFALERGSIGGTIPSSYGNLKSLLLLDFDFNQLTGTIPSSLWSLTNLRQLDLNDNQLVGTLSEDIGDLRQLRFFQIDNNNLEGMIPATLGDIPNFSEYLSYDLHKISNDILLLILSLYPRTFRFDWSLG